jgi:hypothetical protein
MQKEQTTLAAIAFPQQHKNHQKSNKHFLIRRIRRHLVTQFSVGNGNKQISQVCRTICENFI